MTRPTAGAYRDALVEHVTADLPPGYVHAPHPMVPVLMPETPEDRERSARVKRAADISARRSDVKPPRWGSARAAILEYARHVTYGATAKSPSAIHARIIDEHRTASSTLAPRDEAIRYDQAGAAWIAEVAQALDAAYVVPWVVHVSPRRVEIPAGFCRTILVLRVCGKPVAQPVDRTVGDAPGERAGDLAKGWRRTRTVAWVEQSSAQLADDVSGYVSAEVTVGVIDGVVRAGLRSVTDKLSAAGLVPEAKRRQESDYMASNDPDRLTGWKDVAAACGIEDEKTARRWHARYPGMPVRFTPSGRVYASRSELLAWCEKENERIKSVAGRP